jgi:hypothetical protein
MPWNHEWVPPEVAFYIHTPDDEDIPVFHAYKNNEWNHRLSYWYTLHDGSYLDADDQDISHLEFDIRSFPTYDVSMDHQDIMQCAYDNALCTIEDVMIYIEPTSPGTTDAKH